MQNVSKEGGVRKFLCFMICRVEALLVKKRLRFLNFDRIRNEGTPAYYNNFTNKLSFVSPLFFTTNSFWLAGQTKPSSTLHLLLTSNNQSQDKNLRTTARNERRFQRPPFLSADQQVYLSVSQNHI